MKSKLHALECKIRGYFFRKRLKKVAEFIEKYSLYPVYLDKDLLQVWKNK